MIQEEWVSLCCVRNHQLDTFFCADMLLALLCRYLMFFTTTSSSEILVWFLKAPSFSRPVTWQHCPSWSWCLLSPLPPLSSLSPLSFPSLPPPPSTLHLPTYVTEAG